MSSDPPKTRTTMPLSGEAAQPERVYRRAMRDFSQIARHRLAAPLTSMAAGIEALQELDDHLDEDTRREVLAALQKTACELETAILHPELTRDGAGDGAVPRLDGTQLAQLLVADIVEAEQHARAINERLFMQVADRAEQPVDFLCECWAIECQETVTLPMADYWIVHARHDQFVVAPGHELPAVEQVVERHGDWWVVRKSAEVMRTALHHRLGALS
jgi:signal transduction histidine kinase